MGKKVFTDESLATFVDEIKAYTDESTSTKMDKENPTGTGSFSMNRKEGTAIGNYSHAEGLETTASGDYGSHAEGNQTEASNYASHAEGGFSKAKGIYSHAEGYYAEAQGSSSHAEGTNTLAKKEDSHAEGTGTSAYGMSQHVQGKYNIVDMAGAYAHIVGNGTSESLRSNAHTLDWEGNAWFSGNIYVGGTSQTDANMLTSTKELTQSEYDALTEEEKNNGTIYLITDSGEIAEAGQIAYDNTDNGLNATNVQGAIDEVNSKFKQPVSCYGLNHSAIRKHTNTLVAQTSTLIRSFQAPATGIYLVHGFLNFSGTFGVLTTLVLSKSSDADFTTTDDCLVENDTKRSITGIIRLQKGEYCGLYARATSIGSDLVDSDRYTSIHYVKVADY